MYIPTGHYYTDVTTDYIKVIPHILVFSKSSSLKHENDKNDHLTHRVVAKHVSIHLFTVFTFTITWPLSDTAYPANKS